MSHHGHTLTPAAGMLTMPPWRPMGITWKLETLIPAALFEKFAALLAA